MKNVTVYCFSEGDLHYFEHSDDVLEGAFPVITGRENKVKKIIERETVEGDFSGEKKPMVKLVNQLANMDDPIGAVDAFGDWVDGLKIKYSSEMVHFH